MSIKRPNLDRPLVSTRYLAAILQVPRHRLETFGEVADSLYRPFTLTQRKKGRRKERSIDNPVLELKQIQKRIKERLLDTIAFPSFVCGGVRKRSTQDNARQHLRRPEVVALDIKDFFGTVTNDQVAKLWRDRFGASTEVAWLLTRLTTYNGHLPQGAPSSTALANLVMLPVVSDLAALCRPRNVRLTIYVDDITVSGRGARFVIPMVANALSAARFKLARNKVKVMPRHLRQEVTGHTVNRCLSNGRELIKRARAVVLRATSAEATEKDVQRARGLVGHVSGTRPSQARWLEKRLKGSPSA